jgi:membrane protein implicated in regulation of membrane protease activity
MHSELIALRVACIVFGLVSLAQLARLVAGAEVLVDGHLVPLWVSGIAFLVTGGLAAWMGRLSYRGTKRTA